MVLGGSEQVWKYDSMSLPQPARYGAHAVRLAQTAGRLGHTCSGGAYLQGAVIADAIGHVQPVSDDVVCGAYVAWVSMASSASAVEPRSRVVDTWVTHACCQMSDVPQCKVFEAWWSIVLQHKLDCR